MPRKGKEQAGFAAAWDAMFAMEKRGRAMLGNSYEKRSRGEVSQRARGKGEVKQGLATAKHTGATIGNGVVTHALL